MTDTIDVLSVGIAMVVGFALGVLHFGGLWLTVQYLPTVRRPHLILWASTLGRIGVSLVGFYLVIRSGWGPLLVCLGGFLGVRYFLMRRWRTAPTSLLAPGGGRHGCHPD